MVLDPPIVPFTAPQMLAPDIEHPSPKNPSQPQTITIQALLANGLVSPLSVLSVTALCQSLQLNLCLSPSFGEVAPNSRLWCDVGDARPLWGGMREGCN